MKQANRRTPREFEDALAAERVRNGRQITAFRFWALATILVLQLVFLATLPGWMGAPVLPQVGYVSLAAAAYALNRYTDRLTPFLGFTIAFVDMPMVAWLVDASARASLGGNEPAVAAAMPMMAPIVNAALIVLSSLTLHNSQTVGATAMAIALQSRLLFAHGRDATFVCIVALFTAFTATIAMYLRDRTVRLVRRTVAEQLRRARLGRYFSPQVATLLERGHVETGGERRRVTILFCDIRNFTGIAEQMDSRQVLALLNRFHAAMVEEVFRHGGTLDKYLGDGLLAYFGAPVEQKDHAARAVRCALDMQSALARLNEHEAAIGGQALRMGIGVHSGDAIVGDVGAEKRREYTVVGDAVNVAARLEELTKAHREPILLSRATADAAGRAFGFRHVDEVSLRGRTEAIEVLAPRTGAAQTAAALPVEEAWR